MSKVICDICGTQYPDTADQCPICGYAREIAGQTVYDSEPVRQVSTNGKAKKSKGGKFSEANVRRRAQEETILPEKPKKVKPDNDTDERARSGSNAALVVLLMVLIMTLLATTAFIFVRYLLPNMSKPEVTEPTEQTQEQTVPDETELTTVEIPCEALALTSGGTINFTEAGQMSLLNVVIIPSDSTDELTYSSSDENVATVNEEGRVTCAGEGEAVITISCGKRQMQCNVICVFETEPPETEVPTDSTQTEE